MNYDSITIKVGNKETVAKHRIENVEMVRMFLNNLTK